MFTEDREYRSMVSQLPKSKIAFKAQNLKNHKTRS